MYEISNYFFRIIMATLLLADISCFLLLILLSILLFPFPLEYNRMPLASSIPAGFPRHRLYFFFAIFGARKCIQIPYVIDRVLSKVCMHNGWIIKHKRLIWMLKYTSSFWSFNSEFMFILKKHYVMNHYVMNEWMNE